VVIRQRVDAHGLGARLNVQPELTPVARELGIIGLMPEWMDIPDWVDEMFEPIRNEAAEVD
jgi:hypothetical protein